MPYIKAMRKKFFEDILCHYITNTPQNSGELNFLFTMLSKQYLHNQGESYQTYNDIIGALEGSKLELYRKQTALYEDKKEKENGTVWQ